MFTSQKLNSSSRDLMSFSYASAKAKKLSVLYQRTIKLCREGSLFYIEYLPLDDFSENNLKLQNKYAEKKDSVNGGNEKFFITEAR